MIEEVVIDHVGVAGDGVAKTKHGAVYVPFALPHEVANIAVENGHGTIIALKKSSPERVEAKCRHFEACGGCALQHWADDPYQMWKRSLVVEALEGRKITTDVEPVIPCEPHTRRRMILTARVTPKGQIVGFNRYQSHDVIAIEECPVSRPELVDELAAIRSLAALLANYAKEIRINVTLAENGIDVALEGCKINDEKLRQRLVEEGLKQSFIRLTADGEIIIEKERPELHFGSATVELAAGGFLQATKEAEEFMASLVMQGLKKAKNAADLFSGAGTFTFRMAEKMKVHAVENDDSALKSLDRAYRQSVGLKTVTYEKRDLFRRPLLPRELEAFDGLVFDPPRAGAEEQAREIAKMNIPHVVAVSCNPVTMSRDLSILVEGGYTIEKLVPIDQFLWSPHVEAVALLKKRKPKPGWRL
ncbi:class I SAM-dependent RNA methyltransferase [Bartonella choladocola]|uniref:23S rRNA m(5)U-1939 methyltransferase n=1 Tax=Bartonella choladocola TaxID=2750995 RepID=A0A1U9MGK4_9HYPH|nr:class I SAM-dependent RNA methyltransferase [Bartonella choladocola]AQT46840.1 23S rRNA m(5)U-1939 methyltransferase [Bartonella choladocola]